MAAEVLAYRNFGNFSPLLKNGYSPGIDSIFLSHLYCKVVCVVSLNVDYYVMYGSPIILNYLSSN